MANEISISLSASLDNGTLSQAFSVSDTVTQTTALALFKVLVVTTTEAAVSISPVTTNGFVFLQNLDAINFVKYGPESGGAMIEFGRIYPGEIAAFRLASGITLRVDADTATCNVALWAWNN